MKRWACQLGLGVGLALSATAEPWTLERAIAHALTNSPEARLAQRRIASARAALQQANAAFWPQLQFQSSYTRTDNPMSVFGDVLNQHAFSSRLDFNDVPDADNLNVKGQLTVPLYNGGRTRAGRESARASIRAAQQNAAAVRNDLAFEVTRAFETVLKTLAFIDASEAAVRSFQNNLGIASNRFNAGTILKTEVLDVEVRLAQAREDLVRARNAYALGQRALTHLLGFETGELTITTNGPAPELPSASDFSGRPEFAAMVQRQRAARADLRRAQGGYLPRFSAFGSVDHDEGWKFDGSGDSYTAGVLFQWDIWDGQLTRGKANAARAELAALEEEDRKLRLAIDLEAEQARLNTKTAQERLAATEKAVAQASESVALTRSRFEQGLALATQLIDAEAALTAARVRRADAEAERRIAIGSWRKALGLPQVSALPATP